MQANFHERQSLTFPEYYLSWTLQHPELMISRWKTFDGRTLEIIDPGQCNLDNGPDFLQALIKVDGVLMRGDIEVHRDWQDWYHHGHDSDRRYNQVILHVLWDISHEIFPELIQRFPHFIISRHLRYPFDEWLKYMEQLGEAKITEQEKYGDFRLTSAQVQQLAWHRFYRKCDEIRQWVNDFNWNTAVFMGLAKSLGYSKNSVPFVELVKKMPPDKILAAVHPLQRSPLIFWTLLAWQGGLLDRPLPHPLSAESDLWYRFVHHIRKQFLPIFPLSRMGIIHWNFARLRPLNNPYFRLAGYAQILFHFQEKSLFEQLLHLFCQREELTVLLSELEDILCLPLSVEFDPILKKFLGYQALPRKTMGKRRCRLFILNILLPLFYVWSQVNNNPGFSWYLEELFFTFPAVDQNTLLDQFTGSKVEGDETKAYVQQALLEYHEQQFQSSSLIIGKKN